MLSPISLKPIDYLLVGHLTCDITPDGLRLGGTVAYSALVAQALGLRVGIVTSWGSELPIDHLDGVQIVNYPTERSTTFKNIETPTGRQQTIYHIAPTLDYHNIPESWRNTDIVHIAPVAQEVAPGIVGHFSDNLVGLTPQGWLRSWDADGRVHKTEWPESDLILRQSSATVIGIEDIDGDEVRIDEMAASCRVMVVTEGPQGARLYWHGDVRRFRPSPVEVADPTGAGDVFATAFFTRLYLTRDPWESARFATQLASYSVTRPGVEGVPTPQEIEACTNQII